MTITEDEKKVKTGLAVKEQNKKPEDIERELE